MKMVRGPRVRSTICDMSFRSGVQKGCKEGKFRGKTIGKWGFLFGMCRYQRKSGRRCRGYPGSQLWGHRGHSSPAGWPRARQDPTSTSPGAGERGGGVKRGWGPTAITPPSPTVAQGGSRSPLYTLSSSVLLTAPLRLVSASSEMSAGRGVLRGGASPLAPRFGGVPPHTYPHR